MNQRTVTKIGLFTVFAMLVGSVVGIGIFLKNNSVFRAAGYNPTSIILSWVIACLICIVTGLSYIDISLSAFSRLGLARWAEKVGGKKLGYFIKFNLPVFYYGLLLPGISYFAAEILLLNFSGNYGGILSDGLGKFSSISLVIFVGTGLYLSFLIFNYISLRGAAFFQRWTLVIKFIPLIAVMIFGIVFGAVSGQNNLFFFQENPAAIPRPDGQPAFVVQNLNLNSIIVALPAILFAFDSFLNFGTLVPDMKKPKRDLPFVVAGGIITIGVVYLVITIAQILVSQGISWNVFNANNLVNTFGITEVQARQISGGITQAFFALILISVLGVLNGFSASSINLYAGTILENQIIGTRSLLKFARGNEKLAGLYLQLIISSLWTLLYIGLSYGFNSDVFIDGITNFPTLFFFLIYGLLPLLSLIKKVKAKVTRDRRFWVNAVFAVISFVGCWFVVLYQAIYVFFIRAFMNTGMGIGEAVGWGGFAETLPTATPYYWGVAVLFLVLLAFFAFAPFVNNFIRKLINNRPQKYSSLDELRDQYSRRWRPAKGYSVRDYEILDEPNLE
ncbi:APA family basic amino acid/polyamine antiporter [Mycoplasmoides fastidiosum]|uniref:APA family basic amino acid/polyamine antiporter n=1 Tax=Mycoplasmoides fastidiosum TaxID=92758 RepID=A0ABU0LYX7_9BACT|nr:amino acid permease [Mycoplasmoides fastidiosum]MDQ0513808.1 APA family basic amino acid/polyamine antiporter [Mycoplasmoides fastidiosum]UUD37774.1 amino acid permease [Mycoplasmoides fastidiosum]